MSSLREFKNNSSYGFSLIELMVVISIITVLSLFCLPMYHSMQIKAARVEMKYLTRNIFVLAESYKSENGIYPGLGNYGLHHAGGAKFDDCETSTMKAWGFSASGSCDQLRYYYMYSGPPMATISATSTEYTYIASGSRFGHGRAAIPNRYCWTDGTVYGFRDTWFMNTNEEMTTNADALKECR